MPKSFIYDPMTKNDFGDIDKNVIDFFLAIICEKF